jgi:hypothetical protein
MALCPSISFPLLYISKNPIGGYFEDVGEMYDSIEECCTMIWKCSGLFLRCGANADRWLWANRWPARNARTKLQEIQTKQPDRINHVRFPHPQPHSEHPPFPHQTQIEYVVVEEVGRKRYVDPYEAEPSILDEKELV